MSTVKVDNIVSSHLPLPFIQGVGDLQSFVAVASQSQFVLTKFDSKSKVRVFVGKIESTIEWINVNTFKVTFPAIVAGSKVYAYKVLSDTAFELLGDSALLKKATINESIAGTVDDKLSTPKGVKAHVDSRLSSTGGANKILASDANGKVSNSFIDTVGTGTKVLMDGSIADSLGSSKVIAPSQKAVTAGLATKIGDAPSDGKKYVRLNGQWVETLGGGAVRRNEQLFDVVGVHSWTAPAKYIPNSLRVTIAGGGDKGSNDGTSTNNVLPIVGGSFSPPAPTRYTVSSQPSSFGVYITALGGSPAVKLHCALGGRPGNSGNSADNIGGHGDGFATSGGGASATLSNVYVGGGGGGGLNIGRNVPTSDGAALGNIETGYGSGGSTSGGGALGYGAGSGGKAIIQHINGGSVYLTRTYQFAGGNSGQIFRNILIKDINPLQVIQVTVGDGGKIITEGRFPQTCSAARGCVFLEWEEFLE